MLFACTGGVCRTTDMGDFHFAWECTENLFVKVCCLLNMEVEISSHSAGSNTRKMKSAMRCRLETFPQVL